MSTPDPLWSALEIAMQEYVPTPAEAEHVAARSGDVESEDGDKPDGA